jgi:hypothetical protein
MNRPAIAFIVAPLLVPLAMATYYSYAVFPYPEQRNVVALLAAAGAISSYGSIFALGLPAFIILRSRSLTGWWIFAVLGVVFGLATWLILLVSIFLYRDWNIEGLIHELHVILAVERLSLLRPGLLGAAVGLTHWLIARPDQAESIQPSHR